MRKKPNSRYLPVMILPAVIAAALLPLMARGQVPDYALGGIYGFVIGLSAVGLFWMAKNRRRCAPGSESQAGATVTARATVTAT
jgi:hypothetical protein